MLQIITQDQHPDYSQQFNQAVRTLFPILCFTPDQTEAFLQEFPVHFDGQSCVVADGQGRLTFCRYTRENPGEIYLDYLIPSVWEGRYALVQEAILQLKHEFLVVKAERALRMHIDERVPSHNAYYLGLLPALGFTLTPRVTMIAAQAVVRQLTLPPLPPNLHEMPYQADQVAAVIDAYARAFSGKQEQDLSPAEWSQLRAEEGPYITRMYGLESTMLTWTGLGCEGKLIGCAFGCAREQRLCLEEVALVPEFQGKGLGRYLTIRCLQNLAERYGGPDKYFFLGTDRRWSAALKLYHRLGFTLDKIESYAFLTNNTPDA